ncbi:MAG: 50S ribosomal protein L23 [Mariprofundaceae bacterium]|nr:50S ribosomal protein L23 [Mariprofundaceae bacterium]
MSANYEHFKILRRPVITEKSVASQGENNQYVIQVAPDANKNQVKAAIESIFEVKVEKVQVINLPGKEKRRGNHVGRRTGSRKAVIRLSEGQSIPDMMGEV